MKIGDRVSYAGYDGTVVAFVSNKWTLDFGFVRNKWIVDFGDTLVRGFTMLALDASELAPPSIIKLYCPNPVYNIVWEDDTVGFLGHRHVYLKCDLESFKDLVQVIGRDWREDR